MWEIELLPEFAEWWRELPEETQQAISHDMRLLAMRGMLLSSRTASPRVQAP